MDAKTIQKTATEAIEAAALFLTMLVFLVTYYVTRRSGSPLSHR